MKRNLFFFVAPALTWHDRGVQLSAFCPSLYSDIDAPINVNRGSALAVSCLLVNHKSYNVYQ